ncbi:MAG: hypothetical protein V3W20_07015, partial [Candidatus Neomarinimicrobiota bacterium]
NISFFDGAWITSGNGVGLTVNMKTGGVLTTNSEQVFTSGATHSLYNLIRGLATGFVITITNVNKGPGDLITAGSIDQQAIESQFFNNPEFPDSHSIGTYFISNNALLTSITGGGTWDTFNLDTVIAGDNIERWSIVDATTGEIQYNGLEDFAGDVIFSFSASKSGGAVLHLVRIFKTTAGAIIQAVEFPTQFSTTIQSGSFPVPITMKTGERIRPEISRPSAGTTGITAQFISFLAEK